MASISTHRLNTSQTIPAIGFGTWQDKDVQEKAVAEALKAGYKHIDTAAVCGTELIVDAAVKKSGIPRSELFITTELWNNKRKLEDVELALDESLKDLQMDYVDLYLMHWPAASKPGDNRFLKGGNEKMEVANVDFVDTYEAMEKLLKTGNTKAIGISNFSRAETDRMLKETTVVSGAHQLELHPWLQQKEFCVFNKIIPKSNTPSRIKANLEGDFNLDPADLKKIDAIDKKMRFNGSSKSFNYNFYTDLMAKINRG